MNRRDAAGIVLLTGVSSVAASATGAVLDFLRPNMRIWVGIAGGLLMVIGAVELWRAVRDETPPEHPPARVGWLVAVPICVALTVGSGSLGVYAVGRNATFANLTELPTSFDLEEYVRSASFGGQPVEITLVDLNAAVLAPDNRAVLEGHDLRLIGFVARSDDGDARLTRFVINCCAADGASVQASLVSDQPLPDDGTWIEVVGPLAPEAPAETTTEGDAARPARILVESFREIEEPELPYEFPYSRIG